MIRIDRVRLNDGAMGQDNRTRISGSAHPRFSWSVLSDGRNGVQRRFKAQILDGERMLEDTGWIEDSSQRWACTAQGLPFERRLTFCLMLEDNRGERSDARREHFFLSGLQTRPLAWIGAGEEAQKRALYFRRSFSVDRPLAAATLYVCGLGYHRLSLNGRPLDQARLDPAFSDYSRSVYYVMLPEMEKRIVPGENCLGVVLGDGWRRNEGAYLAALGGRSVPFFGRPQLSAVLALVYADGATQLLSTDEHWVWGYGPILENGVFNGETFDAGQIRPGWDMPGPPPEGFQPAEAAEGPGGEPRLMEIEPIREQQIYPARTVNTLPDGSHVVDFGQNMAGVCRVRLPRNLDRGQTLTLEHMEFLDDDGSLYLPTLRGAACLDRYIAAGDGRDPEYWESTFTYHGFRYACLKGLPLLPKEDICAVSLYSDIASDSFFTCGDGRVNAIERAIVQTEKSNLHGLLTDCPQRDERMGWLNDATVRFEETPYNFDIGRLFPKVLRDIMDAQGKDGSITCTAPYVYGGRPADPVCSSFLVAGLEALMHTGNTQAVAQAYEGFAGWQRCLTDHTKDHIVTYSYYGDWAGPVYACVDGDKSVDAVHSAHTPGEFMSTGYYYYNARLLERFARLLGKEKEAREYGDQAEAIRRAMLEKWWDDQGAIMATGSQGCQAFALWLGIVPAGKEQEAAQRMHEDLVKREYRITTANLTTRYLMDMLTRYGYVDDAWALITRQEYPSLGYMLQNEATTVWERFELKKTPGMNSHNHPMYGAVGFWLYAYIAGIRPTGPGFAQVDIRPYYPRELLSAQASVDTVRGAVSVRWIRRFGRTLLYVTIPFGTWAVVHLHTGPQEVGSGYWVFEDQ